MPEVVRVLHAHLDFPRLRVPMEDAHRIAAMEPILISVCRARISIRSSQRPSRANLKTSDVAGPADGSGAVPSPGGSRRVYVSGDPRGETGLRSAPPSVREGPESVAMDLDALRPRVHLRRRLRPGGGRFRRIERVRGSRSRPLGWRGRPLHRGPRPPAPLVGGSEPAHPGGESFLRNAP